MKVQKQDESERCWECGNGGTRPAGRGSQSSDEPELQSWAAGHRAELLRDSGMEGWRDDWT